MPIADCIVAAPEAEVAAGAPEDEPVVEPVAEAEAFEPEGVGGACVSDEGSVETVSPVAFVQDTLLGIVALLLKVRSAH